VAITQEATGAFNHIVAGVGGRTGD
jgi:hypothetical protein